MDLQAYRDEITLKLTGGVVGLEIPDEALDKIIYSAFREMQRYIDTTKLITIPYQKCIDMSEYNPNSVVCIYRSEGYADATSNSGVSDPMYAMQWQLLGGTSLLSNVNSYLANYGAWSTVQQIRNTVSTDLSYVYDSEEQKLYINVSTGIPNKITIEYVPRFETVEQIKSDYWIDVLIKLSVALTKVALGRIRSKFSQSSALWSLDGDKLLQEGIDELKTLREHLENNTKLNYPID